MDGTDRGVICFPPYTLDVKNLPEGNHTIEFTLFGNRINTFGALHNAKTSETWFGPYVWRTTGDAWCYEYKLKDTGITASPVIEVFDL